jgi:hypothetical protein
LLDVPQKRKEINGKIMSKKVKATCTSFISNLHFETNNLTFTNFNAGSHDPNLPRTSIIFGFQITDTEPLLNRK